MPRKTKQAADDGLTLHTTFRLPRELHELLTKAAAEHGYGIGEEIRRRLEASFIESPTASNDPWFGDLLTAINHAAAGAAKMHPLPSGIREDDDGKRENYDLARLGPDKTPYVAFTEAVTTLMLAFEPDGVRAVANATLIRLSDQLVGIALGALGERGLAAFANLSDVDREFMKGSGGGAQAFAVKAEKHIQDEEGSEP